MTEQFLHTTTDAANSLGVSTAWVRRLAQRDGIGRRVGRDWVFRESDVPRLRTAVEAARGRRGRPRTQPKEGE